MSRERRNVRQKRSQTLGYHQMRDDDEGQGFMKALIGSDNRILGFTMIGSEAGEVMTAVQTAMLADLPYPRLRDAAYRGQRAVIRQHAPKAQDFTNRRYRHRGVVDPLGMANRWDQSLPQRS